MKAGVSVGLIPAPIGGNEAMRMNRTRSLILIVAVVALVFAIWLPSRGTAHAAAPHAYVFPDENPNYVPPAVDNESKPSPFPAKPDRQR